MKNILVTGGAGYIGSYCVRELSQKGYNVVVLDNLISGHIEAIPPNTPFYRENFSNTTSIRSILKKHNIEVVMHFAAYAYVGESVNDPLKYYINNLADSIYLLNAMLAENVKKLIFSSSCVVYGTPTALPITENTPLCPINPYGQTKLAFETLLKNSAKAYGISSISLRYFNASGAAPDGSLGEDHNPETRLIPQSIFVALGKKPHLEIFGNDYPTPDGTCLRDYIHVIDIARAHVLAISKLEDPGICLSYNLATGTPHSVKTVIKMTEAITNKSVPYIIRPRRPGDPASLYAHPQKAMQELGWSLEYPQLESIIKTAWAWHSTHPKGFASSFS